MAKLQSLLMTNVLLWLHVNAQSLNLATTIHEKDGHQIMFYPVGEYATSTEYFHVIVDVDAGQHLDFIQRTTKHFEVMVHVANIAGHKRPEKERITENAIHILKNMKQSLDNHIYTMPGNSITKRSLSAKKFANQYISSTFFININNKEVQSIANQNEANQFNKYHILEINTIEDDLFPRLTEQKFDSETFIVDWLHNHPSLYQSNVQRALFNAEQVRDDVVDIIQTAQMHRLSTKTLTKDVLFKVFENIKTRAKRHGYTVLIDQPSELYQVEASYFTSEDKKMKIIVHVPMVKGNNLLTMYKYIPLPLLQNYANGTSIIPNVGSKDIIAIKKDKDTLISKVLGHSDLLACNKFGTKHLCEERNFYSTKPEESCIGSMFTHNLDGVLRNCLFNLLERKEQVFALNGDEYLIFSEMPHLISVECPMDTYQLSLGVISKLVIQESCKVNLKNHLLIAGPRSFKEDSVYHTKWVWDAKLIFPNMEIEDINDLIFAMKDAGIYILTSKDIQKWQFDNKNRFEPLVNTVLMLCVLVTLLIGFVGLFVVLKCHCFGKKGCEVMVRNRVKIQVTKDFDANKQGLSSKLNN